MISKEIEFYKGGQCDRKAEIEKILTFENDDIVSTPVKICRQNSLVYAAVQIYNKKTKEKNVVGKVFLTSTNLKWDKLFEYTEYDETSNPEYISCPSSILKKLSPTTDKNAKMWRQACKDTLGGLAAEKVYDKSLTNLPVGSRIKLINKANEEGNPIILIKDTYPKFTYPVWVDEETDDKYKICEIQSFGYELIERG